MKQLVTVAEMRAIEKEADAKGVSYQEMMERAGNGIVELVDAKWQFLMKKTALGLIGSGNNGGDVLVALAGLADRGWTICAYIVRPRDDDDPLIERVKGAGGKIVLASKDKDKKQLAELIGNADLLLDGVLGTGIQLPLKDEVAEILSFVAAKVDRTKVVAVDCPSGVDCDTGEMAPECIPASITVCMEAVKKGLLCFPAFKHVGRIEVVDLGLPEKLNSRTKINDWVVDEQTIADLLPERSIDAHKGTFGTAMIVAGSVNYTGAALLAGKAAYRAGVGLVRMAVPGPLHGALAGNFPEATWLLLPHELGVVSENAYTVLEKNLDKVSALLLGPGWGVEDTTGKFLSKLLFGRQSSSSARRFGFIPGGSDGDDKEASKDENCLPPLVIDADGLNLLAKIDDWYTILPEGSLLTPHPGEMSVLTGLDVKQIQANRLEVAKEYAKKWNQVVILKGAITVIASPDGKCCLIPVATSALACAGSGDVLAGFITGILAQGVNSFDAAVVSAWLHAQAGLLAEEVFGHSASVIAGDILDFVVDVYADLI